MLIWPWVVLDTRLRGHDDGVGENDDGLCGNDNGWAGFPANTSRE